MNPIREAITELEARQKRLAKVIEELKAIEGQGDELTVGQLPDSTNGTERLTEPEPRSQPGAVFSPRKLVEIRKARGLGQTELAQLMDYKGGSIISRWETAKAVPSEFNIGLLARALDTWPSRLKERPRKNP